MRETASVNAEREDGSMQNDHDTSGSVKRQGNAAADETEHLWGVERSDIDTLVISLSKNIPRVHVVKACERHEARGTEELTAPVYRVTAAT